MRWRGIAALAALVISGCVWEAPVAAPSFPVDYPIRTYRFHDETDLAAWKAEVRAFRASLRRKYNVEVSAPTLVSENRERQFLDRAVDPRELVWRDPRYFFKTPILLSWWEVIDERGRVQHVYVVASNQPKEIDARVLAWCANDKLWKPAEFEGNPTLAVRSASINLGESRFHYTYWMKRIDAVDVVIATLAAIGILTWFIARTLQRRRERRLRHDALIRYASHAHFHPPSIDEEPKL
ncbi:MAG: hypothetical protein HYU52_15670 [Acidobacteria bacterium]|nr:hypothetical protein [Acidobacteriota bacterium]